jgi:hypothetical protein
VRRIHSKRSVADTTTSPLFVVWTWITAACLKWRHFIRRRFSSSPRLRKLVRESGSIRSVASGGGGSFTKTGRSDCALFDLDLDATTGSAGLFLGVSELLRELSASLSAAIGRVCSAFFGFFGLCIGVGWKRFDVPCTRDGDGDRAPSENHAPVSSRVVRA